jgi:hypothetical protein
LPANEGERNMNIYAMIYLGLNLFFMGVIAMKHGQASKFNFWGTLFMWCGVTLPLLYMAGTFN